MTTLSELIKETYLLLGEPSDTTGDYEQNEKVIPRINEIINRVCKGNVRNLINQQKFTAGDLPFMRRDEFIDFTGTSTLQGEITTLSTQITTETSHFAISGSVFIGQDFINYTGKTATELTGVTNIGIYHNVGEKIYPLYELPADTGQPFTMYRLDTKGNQIEIPYHDYRYPNNGSEFYSIIDGKLLIHADKPNRYKMIYYIESTNLSQPSDVCIIPEPYAKSIIPPLVAGELLRDTEEVDDAQTKLNRGYSNLVEMYDYYSSLVKKNRETMKTSNLPFNGLHGKRRPNNRIR